MHTAASDLRTVGQLSASHFGGEVFMRPYSFMAILALTLTIGACTDGATSVPRDLEVVSFLSSSEVPQNGRFIVGAVVDNTTGKSQRLMLKCGQITRVVPQMAGQPLTLTGIAPECNEDAVPLWLAPGEDFRQLDTLYAEDDRGVALLPGSYTIELQPHDPDLAPRFSELHFKVVSAFATVQVNTITTGTDLDPTGYVITLAGDPVTLMANDSVRLEQVPAGTHTLEIGGLSPNCEADVPAQELIASARQEVRVVLHLTCRFTLAGKVVFSAEQPDGATRLHWRRADGADGHTPEAPPVLTNGEGGRASTISPDGFRLVFSARSDLGEDELFIMNADGTGRTRLTSGSDPDWSADGSRIAFGHAGSLHLIRPDGSGQESLNQAGRHPSFSPDGAKIVFAIEIDFGVTVLGVMDLASRTTTLIAQAAVTAAEPAWSHDGEWIAFSGREEAGGLRKILVVRPDGTDLHVLLEDEWIEPWPFIAPAWSPDDQHLAISTAGTIVIWSRDATDRGLLSYANEGLKGHPEYGPAIQ